jgi:hypothetical protein
MTITLQDPADFDTDTGGCVLPSEPGDPPIAPNERQLSVELQSPGGHLRTVTGTIAYFDEDAQTYMVARPGGCADPCARASHHEDVRAAIGRDSSAQACAYSM